MQPVDFVIAGEVVISIHDPDLSEELASLDTNGDFIVSLNDINEDLDLWSYTKAPAEDKTVFIEAVADAFVNAGVINPSQKKGVTAFFDQYHKNMRFGSIVNKWKNTHTDKGGHELKLGASDWFFDVQRYINEGEPFTAPNIPGHGKMMAHDFNLELCRMIFDLTETEFTDDGQLVFGNLNGPYNRAVSGQIYKIFYDEAKIPAPLRLSWQEFIFIHESTRMFLEEYRDIQCQGNCPEENNYLISNPPELVSTTQTMFLKTKVKVVSPFDKIKEMLEE